MPMPTPVKPIPDGYHTVTPYIICRGAAKAIEFYKQAFGATETMRLAGPDGPFRPLTGSLVNSSGWQGC
jgi:PhnB protein